MTTAKALDSLVRLQAQLKKAKRALATAKRLLDKAAIESELAELAERTKESK